MDVKGRKITAGEVRALGIVLVVPSLLLLITGKASESLLAGGFLAGLCIGGILLLMVSYHMGNDD